MTCAHPGCTCSDTAIVIEGKAYCSPECAHGSAGRSCACGHPDCHASAPGASTPNPGPRRKPVASPTDPTVPTPGPRQPETRRRGR